MKCPHCQSSKTVKNGKARLKDRRQRQNYLCRSCGKRFNDRTNTPMARLRTPPEIVSAALIIRSEGLGIRATGRSFEKSHTTIMGWEERFAEQLKNFSPHAPSDEEVTVEGDEVYTRVRENFSPQ